MVCVCVDYVKCIVIRFKTKHLECLEGLQRSDEGNLGSLMGFGTMITTLCLNMLVAGNDVDIPSKILHNKFEH